jgi:DNA-binding CsgD family transcriptional regulator
MAAAHAKTEFLERAQDADATTRVMLEAFAAAAFIVRSDGVLLLANARGHAEVEAGTAPLARCFAGAADGFDRVVVHALPPGADGLGRALVVRTPDAPPSTASRLARAREKWRLTPHQAAVLALLVHGDANKSIAEHRGCSLRTVEVHVTALLEKSGTASRAELIARFWSSPD